MTTTNPNRALLDTNVVIGLFAGEPRILDRIAACVQAFLPVTVFGELYYGGLHSTRRDQNLTRLEEFARHVAVLSCTTETARTYGRVKTTLAAKGRPIPENDLWIAALAIQHDLTLLTRDGHFEHVESLSMDLLD